MSQARVPPAFGEWVSPEAARYFQSVVLGHVQPGLDINGLRAHYRAFNQAHLDTALLHFPVEISQTSISGVDVYIVRPEKRPHVGTPLLLCLHGGAFMWGEGPGALLEAVPVAAVSGMTVVAVDYRMAPEHEFPAATQDVVAVFCSLMAEQPSRTIGIYGCSAGAILTAQVVAQLLGNDTPLPGAVAMLHATGMELDGDSNALAALLNGLANGDSLARLATLPYLAKADPKDPLVFPGAHENVLRGFPPSLLVSGTRDFAASSVTVMHRRLLAAGVEAELLMFDGMWHAHHMATQLPESRETFDLLAGFFRRHLV